MQIKNAILLAGGCVVVGFGLGLLTGRQFPAHHYEKFGSTSYLLDPTSGKVCDPFKGDQNLFNQGMNAPVNPLDQALKGENGTDANGFPLVKAAVPACGK